MAEAKKTRVVVGMSGGVDSSTAAALLVEQGCDVVGVTLKLWHRDCAPGGWDENSDSPEALDARAVCEKLGIPHHVLGGTETIQRQVIAFFAAEYKAGRTPNPCVLCNEKLKFGALLDYARQLGAGHVATGHYARVGKSDDGRRALLKKGRDPRKDQSYFLFSLRQDQLAGAIFPLGEQTKQDTRLAARERRLKTAERKESMDICFVPGKDYGAFLSEANLAQRHSGDIVNTNGQVLGQHNGIEYFTIGQRKGLGISSPKPLYVIELDAARNRVVVGDDSALERDRFMVERCNWIAFEQPPEEILVSAKIRYNHPGTPATVRPLPGGGALVLLHEAQRAVTPGQACVFYDGDVVAGGGWITAHKE